MSDSILGYVLADLISGDDDDVTGDDELGRRIRKRRARKRAAALASALSAQAAASNPAAAIAQTAAAQSQVQNMEAQIAQMRATMSGQPQTLPNGMLASSSQRREVIHLGVVPLPAALSSTAQLQVSVQRAIQAERLILESADSVTGANDLHTIGVTNVTLGSHNLLVSPGIIGPATAYGRDVWYGEILSVPLGQGATINVNVGRIAAGANASSVSGVVFGKTAGGV